MALDEAKENDIVIEENGLKFVFDEKLDKEVPEISLDYGSSGAGQGFFIRTANASACDSGCDSGCC